MKSASEIVHESLRRRRRSSSSQSRAREDAPSQPLLGETDAAVTGRLIIAGWIISLTYIPSGALHVVLGSVVYLRDLAVFVHLFVGIGWLIKLRQFDGVARRSWFVLLTPILLLPAFANHFYVYEALRTSKWSFDWLDWIVLGYLVRLDHRWREEYKLLFWLTAAVMGAELAAGAFDWVTGRHLIERTVGEKTAFGVSTMSDETVGGHERVRGLQRDVFAFADIMAMNSVAGLACLVCLRPASRQFRGVLWAFAFGALMLLSGGRAALFGVFAAVVYAVGLLVSPRFTRRCEGRYVLVCVGVAITLSLVGVGKFTDFVGNTLLGGSYVGNADSAFMRDDYWRTMLGDFVSSPLILLTGGPFVSLIRHEVDPMFHWADNQFLWNTYHLGLIGAVAFAYPFWSLLRMEPRGDEHRKVRSAFILFLLFAIGEGIARESLVMIGCVPLFVLFGYECAAAKLVLPDTSEPGRRRRSERPSREGSA